MVGLSTNAFAAIGDSVQAVFASFNYVVNGESKNLDEPVLVHDGNSYLRTTQVMNMLGYDVTYRADSRTIEFNKLESTPLPVSTNVPAATVTPSTSPSPTATSTPITDGGTPIVTTTPTPSATPPVDNTSSPTPSPSQTPAPTPAPSVEPSPSVTPSPTPAPSNAAACQAIRDDYSYQIAMVGYSGDSNARQRLNILQLEYARDQALSAAGCN